MPSPKELLVLSLAHDVHADAVCWAFERAGCTPLLFAPAAFPATDLLGGTHGTQDALHANATSPAALDFERPRVVWRRRIPTVRMPEDLHPADAPMARRESLEFLHGLLGALESPAATWVNTNAGAHRAQSKLLQLREARAAGFATPRTLVSNDPQRIRAFCELLGGTMAAKSFSPASWTSASSGKTHVAATARVDRAMLDDTRSLQACPAIYQEYVRKQYELRVTVFGDTVHAVRIESQGVRETVDWRYDLDGAQHWPLAAHRLAPQTEARVLAFMRAMGLAMGCIDLVVTPEGETVFLEVNEQGQFLWIEQDLPEAALLRGFCRFLAAEMGADLDFDAGTTMAGYGGSTQYETLAQSLSENPGRSPWKADEH